MGSEENEPQQDRPTGAVGNRWAGQGRNHRRRIRPISAYDVRLLDTPPLTGLMVITNNLCEFKRVEGPRWTGRRRAKATYPVCSCTMSA